MICKIIAELGYFYCIFPHRGIDYVVNCYHDTDTQYWGLLYTYRHNIVHIFGLFIQINPHKYSTNCISTFSLL